MRPAKTTAKKSAKETAKPRAKAPVSAPVSAAPAPVPAPLAPFDVDASVRRAVADALAERDRADATRTPPPAVPSPFGRRSETKSHQLQVRMSAREHALYTRLAQERPELFGESEPLAAYEVLRHLAWRQAEALGLTAPSGASAHASAA